MFAVFSPSKIASNRWGEMSNRAESYAKDLTVAVATMLWDKAWYQTFNPIANAVIVHGSALS